jgi:signal transduction histidine kinase
MGGQHADERAPLASTLAPTAGPPADVVPDDDRLHRSRARFALLAETSRLLSGPLEFQPALEIVAALAVPHFGAWCLVDLVERDGSFGRVAVMHPDAAKQQLARDYYDPHPPSAGDAIGAPRVMRASQSDLLVVTSTAELDATIDAEHRRVLQELGATSFLIIPMRARGQILGAITFVSDVRRDYDHDELVLAEDLGRRCAMALDNARLVREAARVRGAAESAFALAETAREDAAYAALRSEALRAAADAAREDAEAASRSKTRFLTTMSHEFRTPLGIVLGYVDLLKEEIPGPLTGAQQNYLQRIARASKHLLRLIEEVLTLSQVDAGRAEVRFEAVDLSALLRDAVALLAPIADAKGLALPLVLPDGPVVFPTDPGKFRQIVFNLAANAIKFTNAGEVRITLSEEDRAVLLRVKDTGVGISPDDAEHLFESYWQVHQAPGRHEVGTGLGLSITRQLAQLLGGDVQVESSAGGGSTFTVRLPRTAPDAPAEPPRMRRWATAPIAAAS